MIAARPLVSVVLPVFNAERFLAEALASIRQQAYEPLEVLVVDDASTDGSLALAAPLRERHPGLRVLEQPENRGPAAARNAGLAASQGELVTFLDADDLMTPGRIRFQVDYLTGHPEVDVVVGTERTLILPGVAPPPALRWPGRGRPRFCQMSMMVRRPVFGRVGVFDPSYRVGEDTEWMYRAWTAGVRTALADRDLLVRRIHGANVVYQADAIRHAARRALLETARSRLRDGSRAR